jgi:TonB family protein
MLDHLVASRPVSWAGRYVSAGSVSSIVHTSIIAFLALATVRGRPIRAPVVDTTMVWVSAQSQSEAAKPDAVDEGTRRQIVLAGEQLRGFQTIAALSEIPTSIPAVDLSQRFDPRDYSGVGVEGGVADGLVVDPAVVTTAVVYASHVTEIPPELLSTPVLEYPPILRQAAVEGVVTLEFVVDTAGRVEMSTVRVAECSHAGFSTAAINVARGALFRPGRVAGRAVRVLVRMPVEFVLHRGV